MFILSFSFGAGKKSRNDGTLLYANSKFGTGETLFSRIKKNIGIQFSGVLDH
jgi:hypothetical protein